MNCPNCNTFNPDERDKCWRCDAPLPRPVEKKKRDPRATNQIMMYVLIAALLVFSLLQMCQGFGGTPAEATPSSYVPHEAPAAAGRGVRV